MSFKKCKVVMLSTNEKAMIGLNYNNLFYCKGNNMGFENSKHIKSQHLYITSDEEIKEDDYSVGDEGVFGPYGKGDILPSNSKRIIATTDTSLGFPQPSQQFIEKYIKEYNLRNIIANVLVEYLEGHIDIHSQITPLDCKVDYFNEYGRYGGLKVNKKDNTITIKKVKDSWNRNEVISLIKEFDNSIRTVRESEIKWRNNWIKTNL